LSFSADVKTPGSLNFTENGSLPEFRSPPLEEEGGNPPGLNSFAPRFFTTCFFNYKGVLRLYLKAGLVFDFVFIRPSFCTTLLKGRFYNTFDGGRLLNGIEDSPRPCPRGKCVQLVI